ncbi:DUF6382 domain-containing protein [Aquibacillus kalidii]|uniref:DUF6382 domain-containing protein n=1 Tax=Aquibacillus kalidii TaxID=2762597 RepID=UPI001648E9D3|nr:DUF6382 domain-containing protein [Aquibacillus kalidii]
MIKHVDLSIEDYGSTSFLYYKVSSDQDVPTNVIDQIAKSNVPGILPCVAIKTGDDTFIRYDITSTSSLENYLSRSVSKQQLTNCLGGLLETLIKAAHNGLQPNNFLFNKKYMYIDTYSNQLIIPYLPIDNQSVYEQISLSEFIRQMLSTLPYNLTDDLEFFIKLHNYIATEADLTAMKLKAKLNELAPTYISNNMEQAAKEDDSDFYSPGSRSSEFKHSVNQGVLTSEYSTKKVDKKKSKRLEIEEEVNYKRVTKTELDENSTGYRGNSLPGTSINIGSNLGNGMSNPWIENSNEGTTVLGAVSEDEEEGTTTLGISQRITQYPYLIAQNNNEKITIDKEIFKIGRDPKNTDYMCANRVVGRIHAKVYSCNGEYFVEDNNSTNGSYVNGMKLTAYEKKKIRHEDTIKLANEEFTFHVF